MNLKQYLEHYCVNVRSFARKAGVSPGTVYRIIEQRSVTLEKAVKICKATNFEVTLQELAPPEK